MEIGYPKVQASLQEYPPSSKQSKWGVYRPKEYFWIFFSVFGWIFGWAWLGLGFRLGLGQGLGLDLVLDKAWV